MGKYEIFANRLKELRNSMFLTQKEFADKIGFTQATLSAYENNPKNPSLDIVRDISQKCDVSIDWLCGLTDKRSLNDKLTTYSDVILLLLKISLEANLSIIVSADSTAGYMAFHSEGMRKFLEEWEKMKELYDANTIDIEVYDLWMEKTIAKYNYTIGSMDDLPFM